MLAGGAHAHKASDSFLRLTAAEDGAISLSWDIALVDLEQALGIDASRDGAITWGEVRGEEAAIYDYAREHLAIARGGTRCALVPSPLRIDTHSDGSYAALQLHGQCAAAGALELTYSLLFDIDPTHRGLLAFDGDGSVRTAVLGPDDRVWTQGAVDRGSWRTIIDFVADGMHHIAIGYDHIAFLLLLLLPAGLVRDRSGAVAAPGVQSVVVEALKIVTAFTLAHSLTLGLATFGVVTLAAKPVEVAIAASVIAAALYNLWPRAPGRRWMIASGFGLVHGFGFANVLTDLGLTGSGLALPLAAFNVGVELGQLAIVAVALPLILGVRKLPVYPRVLVPVGSLCVAVLAAYWMLDRVSG